MQEFFNKLLDTNDFVPRWRCGRWAESEGWLHILSDLGVWSAYVAIPLVLAFFLIRKKSVPFRGVFILFVAFILACGMTHLMEAVLFWWPAYRLAGTLKLFTAIVSWITVLALIPTVPKALALKSQAELEREIAERRLAEAALHQSEELFRLLVREVEDYAIILLDVGGHISSWNAGAERCTGYRAPEILGQHFSRFFPEPDLMAGKPDTVLAQARLLGKAEDEGWRIRKDGTRFWANVVLTALRDGTGELKGYSKITRDLTAKKRIEDQLRASLHEKQMMLQEIHHRVKNNLQVVCSLLDLQSHATNDPDAVAMFRQSQQRVRSMALVHERLYHTESLSQIDFSEYVRELLDHLFASYPLKSESVRCAFEAEPVRVGIDIAVPCGLIVNELVSNSLKHAFAECDSTGVISVGLTRDHNFLVLSVEDNGVGIPDRVTFEEANTFGLRLVSALIDQLRGTVTIERKGTTIVTIRVPTPGCIDTVSGQVSC